MNGLPFEARDGNSNEEESKRERNDTNDNPAIDDDNRHDGNKYTSCCSCCLQNHPRVFFWTAVVFLSLAVILPLEILDVVYRDTSPWIRLYTTETIGNGTDWCEAIDADLTQFIIEPWNSRSDYFFMVLGCFLIVLGISDAYQLWKQSVSTSEQQQLPFVHEEGENTGEGAVVEEGLSPPKENLTNPILRFPHLTIVNGIFNLLHGLGSFWNHACECKQGGSADVSGMLSVIVFAVAYTPVQLFANPVTHTTKNAILLSTLPPICQILLFVLVWHGTIPAIQTFIILVGVTITVIPLSIVYLYCWRNKKTYPIGNGTEKKLQQQQQHHFRWWLFPLGLLCFGLAYWAWQLDLSGVWCFDEGILEILQGHAVWHVLSAVALVCTYYLYRSEQITLITTTTVGNHEEDSLMPNEQPSVEIVEKESKETGLGNIA